MKKIVSSFLVVVLFLCLFSSLIPTAHAAGETFSEWGTTSLDTAIIEKIDKVMHPGGTSDHTNTKYQGHTYRSFYSVDYENPDYFHAQGDFYLSKEKIGLCTDYTLANLINRKLAQYGFSCFVELEDILMVSVDGAPQNRNSYIRGKYSEGNNVYSCIYFMDSNGTNEVLDRVYAKTFEDGSAFCFKIDRGDLSGLSPETRRSILKQELDNKPEGVWVYDGHHAFLLTYYQYDEAGKIHFGAIDSGHWGYGDLSSSKTPMEQTFAVQQYANGNADTMIDQLTYYLVINSRISTITPPPEAPVTISNYKIANTNYVVNSNGIEEILKGTPHDVCGIINGDGITSITVSVRDHRTQQLHQTKSKDYSYPTNVRNLNLANTEINTCITFGTLPTGFFDMVLTIARKDRSGAVSEIVAKRSFYVVNSLTTPPSNKLTIKNASINNLSGSPISIWKGPANLTGTITSNAKITKVKATIFNRKYNEPVPSSQKKWIEYCESYNPNSYSVNLASSPLNCYVNGSTIDYIHFGSLYRGEYALYLEAWDANGGYEMCTIVFIVK